MFILRFPNIYQAKMLLILLISVKLRSQNGNPVNYDSDLPHDGMIVPQWLTTPSKLEL